MKHKDSLFIYIPRKADTVLAFTVDNVKLEHDVNIYEYIKWADIHITISSTTCLEAQYFHTPTIFYDFDNRATIYYGNILKPENGAAYIVDSDDYDSAIKRLSDNSIEYIEAFAQHPAERMKKVINDYLKDE